MRVLSIVHEGTSTGGGGLFEDLVEQRGDRLERWVTVNGGTGPDAPERYDAIMVFGGAMHPDQDAQHPWLSEETAFLQEVLARDVPLLGVCLGAQLVARAAGAWIGPAEASEVGWTTVEVNDGGRDDPVIGVLPDRVDAFQWHHYTFELPAGATLLAESANARQAYRLGEHTWAIQFHAEVTRHMLEAWFVQGADELPKPASEMWAETDSLLGRWNEHGRRLCAAFLDRASSAQPGNS
jgi:GMP synthase-like glutamine amidotransferase